MNGAHFTNLCVLTPAELKHLLCVVFLTTMLASLSAAGEIQRRLAIRDDVEDSQHLVLAESFDAVGNVQIGNRSCSGTLVKSTDGSFKVLTSAHCVDRDSDNVSDVKLSSVSFHTGLELEGPSAHAVAIAIPKWDGKGALDLAVITLGGASTGELPIGLVVSHTNPEGQPVTLVGYGTHGNGMPPFESLFDGRRRAATNTADAVFTDGELEGQIRTDFDHPREPAFSTMGDATPTPLEGTSGEGDSGAPLISGGRVVGVLHGGENPTDFGFSEYGDISIFAGLFHNPNVAFLRANGVLVTGPGDAASQVTIEATAPAGQPFVAAADGSPLPEQSVVHIGTLPRDFDTSSATLNSVAHAWIPFNEITMQSLADTPGRFTGKHSADGTDFFGSKIYWWILGTASDPPASDLANINSWGLFSSSVSHWTVPGSGQADTILLGSAEVDEAVAGSMLDDERLVLEHVAEFTLDYVAWAQSAFPSNTPEADRLQQADPDGDHLANGIEWVLGTAPLSISLLPIQVAKNADGYNVIHYPRRRFLPLGTHEFQFSPNLRNWTPVQPFRTVTRVIDSQFETVELEFDGGSADGRHSSTRYWRLALTNG
jgi:hypothetical protein